MCARVCVCVCLCVCVCVCRANLRLVKEGGDLQAQGRTLGNLGNTFYLIGNFKKAIKYHEEVCLVITFATSIFLHFVRSAL